MKVYYTPQQKQLLKKWIGSCRFAYNVLIEHYRKTKRIESLRFYRNLIKEKKENPLYSFLKDVPYNSLDETLKEAISNMKANKTNNSKRERVHILHFKAKKKPIQTLPIRSQNINDDFKVYPRLLFSKNIPSLSKQNHIEHKRKNNNYSTAYQYCDSKLQWLKDLDRWFLVMNYITPKPCCENQATPNVISIDPGNRTFATWYSPNLGYGKLGSQDIQRIARLLNHLDKLTSKTSKVTSRKRNRFRRAQQRIREKIKNLIRESHRKIAHWLCSNFDIIIIPIFNSKRMTHKKDRNISKITSRQLLSWSHGKFRNILTSKAEEKGVRIIFQNEAYTSKTCSICGHQDHKLGGKTTFNCHSCHNSLDRDVNGARGIFLRALLDQALCQLS